MRVLALVTDGFGSMGGIGQYNCDLARALSLSSAVKAVKLVPRVGSEVGLTGDAMMQTSPKAGRLKWALSAFGHAHEFKPDVIFCGHLYSVGVANVIARAARKPLWLQLHGIEAWSMPGAWVAAAAGQATLVTSVSRYTRQRFLSWCNIAPGRVKVLPNTFCAPVADAPAVRHTLLAKHNLVGRRIILTVGRLSAGERYKGHDRIIAALPTILLREPDAAYVIVGGGDDEVRLKALAVSTGVVDRVVFVGAVRASELMSYFSVADVFAMPSTGEGFGIVYLEAAARGLPVVGGNRDGTVDALADGRIGRLIDPGDTFAIADAIVDALAGRQLSDKDAVQRFCFQNFEDHVSKLVQTFAR